MNYYIAFHHISELLPKDCIIVSEGANTMDIGRTMLLNYLPRHRWETFSYPTFYSWTRDYAPYIWIATNVIPIIVFVTNTKLFVFVMFRLRENKCHVRSQGNVLGYYRNLGSLRYGNEYCVEYRRLSEKNIFFNHAVITARRLVRVGLKNEPMHGGGARANGYATHHSPQKWEGRLAI